MNESLRLFKRVVAQVGDDCGINFFHYGLRDLLLDAGSNPTPAELVARAAHRIRRPSRMLLLPS